MHPSTRFVRGEIVYWRSANSNVEHRAIVVHHYDDPLLGQRVVVKSATHRRPYPIRAERLQRISTAGPTLAGPGHLA